MPPRTGRGLVDILVHPPLAALHAEEETTAINPVTRGSSGVQRRIAAAPWAAMMTMRKIDIAAIEAARRG